MLIACSHEVQGALLHSHRLPQWLSNKNLQATQQMQVQSSWVGKIPWRRKWQLTPVFLPGKFHERRSLEGSMGSQRVGCILATKQQDCVNRAKRIIHLVPGATRGRLTAHSRWVSTESLTFAKYKGTGEKSPGRWPGGRWTRRQRKTNSAHVHGPWDWGCREQKLGGSRPVGAKSKPCQGVRGCQQRKLSVTEYLNSMALPGGGAPSRTMSVDNEWVEQLWWQEHSHAISSHRGVSQGSARDT